MSGTTVRVDTLTPAAEADLQRIFRRAFPPFEQLAFSTKGHGMVATGDDGAVLGGAVVRAVDVGASRMGVVDWIFADPDAPVPGVGSALRDAADAWFDDAGCDEHLARIEPVNTASQELHRRAGYAPLPFRSQLRRWGWRLPLVWLRTHGGIDAGLRPWVRPADPVQPPVASRWAGTVLLNVVLLAVVALRAPRDLSFDPAGLASLVGIAVVLLGVREIAIRVTARLRGLRLGHVPWASGLVIALVLAAAVGVWLPLTGSSVPDGERWRYDDVLPQLAAAHLVGGVVVAAMAWGAVLVTDTPDWLPLADLQRAAVMLALIDLVVPTAPMYGTTARIVVDRSRVAWALLAIAGAGALVYNLL